MKEIYDGFAKYTLGIEGTNYGSSEWGQQHDWKATVYALDKTATWDDNEPIFLTFANDENKGLSDVEVEEMEERLTDMIYQDFENALQNIDAKHTQRKELLASVKQQYTALASELDKIDEALNAVIDHFLK